MGKFQAALKKKDSHKDGENPKDDKKKASAQADLKKGPPKKKKGAPVAPAAAAAQRSVRLTGQASPFLLQ